MQLDLSHLLLPHASCTRRDKYKDKVSERFCLITEDLCGAGRVHSQQDTDTADTVNPGCSISVRIVIVMQLMMVSNVNAECEQVLPLFFYCVRLLIYKWKCDYWWYLSQQS